MKSLQGMWITRGMNEYGLSMKNNILMVPYLTFSISRSEGHGFKYLRTSSINMGKDEEMQRNVSLPLKFKPEAFTFSIHIT